MKLTKPQLEKKLKEVQGKRVSFEKEAQTEAQKLEDARTAYITNANKNLQQLREEEIKIQGALENL